MKQLNVAVIGQGRSGLSIHCAHLSKDTERFKIKYVVDPLEHMRKNAEEKFGCETFADTRSFDKRISTWLSMQLLLFACSLYEGVSGKRL